MPYTTEDGGRLNNFANEPKIYQAEHPSKTEQRNYVIVGILGFGLVVGLIALAFYASSASLG
jgi:hypothetical protein